MTVLTRLVARINRQFQNNRIGSTITGRNPPPRHLIVAQFEDRIVPALAAFWNFNSPIPDGNYATGTTSPAIGSGSLFTLGGTTNSFNLGSINNGSSDPNVGDDTGLNVVGFPTQNQANATAGLGFTVDTRGYRDIVVSFDQRNSNTASSLEVVQYTTNGGASWADAQTLVMNRGESWATGRLVDLSGVVAAADNPHLGFRFVSVTGASGYAASNPGSNYTTRGTWRFDTVAVNGTPSDFSPDAVDDDATLPVGQAVSIPVLANDFYGDGSSVSVSSVGPAAYGATWTPNGTSVVYQPASGFGGGPLYLHDYRRSRPHVVGPSHGRSPRPCGQRDVHVLTVAGIVSRPRP